MRIGIIGAGQLGQMLGFAANELGFECQFIDPSQDPPAARYGKVLQSAFDDPVALAALANACDVITYEFENVPVSALHSIKGIAPVYPPADALMHSQDRLDEKRLFDLLDIPLPNYYAIESRDDMNSAASLLGIPMVIKTRRFGYDGKGQFIIKKATDIDAAWEDLGGQPLIAEQFVAFDFEVSCIGVRNISGEIAIYPLSRNIHVDGILRTSQSPVANSKIADKASEYVHRLLDHLQYVGVLALELFVKGNTLLANEFAPRVHNSGHWSIEGSETSQFENHIRAIAGLPLGSTDRTGYAGMVNLIEHITNATRKLEIGQLHDYEKTPRPNRKLGHVTVVTDTPEKRDRLIDIIKKSVAKNF